MRGFTYQVHLSFKESSMVKFLVVLVTSSVLFSNTAFAKKVVFDNWVIMDGTSAFQSTQIKGESSFRQFIVSNVKGHKVFYFTFFEKEWNSNSKNECVEGVGEVVIRINNTPVRFSKKCGASSYFYYPVSNSAIDYMNTVIQSSPVIELQIDDKELNLGTKKLLPLLEVIHRNNNDAL